MDPESEKDLATGRVAWNLDVQLNCPLHVVAERLNKTPEEIHELLLAMLVQGKTPPPG